MNLKINVYDIMRMLAIEVFSFLVVSFIVKVLSLTGFLDKLLSPDDIMSMIYLGFSLLYGTLLLTLFISYHKFRLEIMPVLIVAVLSANFMFLIKFNGAWFIPGLVLLPYFLLVKLERIQE